MTSSASGNTVSQDEAQGENKTADDHGAHVSHIAKCMTWTEAIEHFVVIVCCRQLTTTLTPMMVMRDTVSSTLTEESWQEPL